jgi:hypothetical protein
MCNSGIGQSASPVERYRSLQELHVILSSSSSSQSLVQGGGGDNDNGRVVEMLLNHSGDNVLCWQLAYITTSAAPQSSHQATRHKQSGGGVDVAVLALLLECLALIWTPKSSSLPSSFPAAVSLPPQSNGNNHLPAAVVAMDNKTSSQHPGRCRVVQSMKQAAHSTLPILLNVGKTFPADVRIQKPLLFILRLYTKIRHAPTKSLLIQSGLVGHLRLAMQKRLHSDTNATDPHLGAVPAGVPGHVNNNNQEDESVIVPGILGLMKDLLFRAESTEKLYMYEEWHAVVLGGGSVAATTNITTAPRYCYYMSTLSEADQIASAEATSACLWNWAVCDELARRMVLETTVWERLQDLLSMPNQQQQPHMLASPHRQEEEYDPQQHQRPNAGNSNHHPDNNNWASVQRNALAALGTMIASCTVTMTRAFSINNNSQHETIMTAVLQQQTWLVPRLCQILDRNDEDKDSRRRCIRTLRCLSACPWGRTFLLGQGPAATGGQNPFQNSSTTAAALHGSISSQQLLTLFLRCLQRRDEELDTRIQASLTIAALLPSCLASEWLAMGPYFETALVQTIEDAAAAADGRDDKLVLTAIQALQVCLEHNPWKRGGSGCFSHQFFESTLRVLRNQMSEPSYHAAIASLILHLVNQKKMSGHVGGGGGDSNASCLTILICPPVVEILSTLLTPLGPDFEGPRFEALQAVVNLTTASAGNNEPRNGDAAVVVDNENYRKNLKTLAANECLLNNLVNLCLIAPSCKDQAKSAILKLVPEL